MMVPKKSLLFAGAALLCLGSVSSAQKQDGPMHRRVTKPLVPAHLDLQTGTITRGAAVQQKGLPVFNTVITINNLDHSGFVGVDSGPAGQNGPCEWIDHANKGTGVSGGESSFMSLFAFAYCSASLDPASGGTGGTARIGFRTGYTAGGGNQGTVAGDFTLTGLPANTACSSFFGGFSCYLIGISVGNTPIVLPDGDLGWSYQFRDTGTDGTLAKTFPFISCVTSCSGSGPDGMGGMIDFVDQYCPAGSLLSTFTFGSGTFGGYFTSISMDVREAEAITSSVAAIPGGGGNPVILTAGAPILGGLTNWGLNCVAASVGKPAIFRFGFAPPVPPLASKWGTILIPITAGTGQNVVIGNHGTGVVNFNIPLPLDLSFYNACWQVQAFCGDAPKGFLSNAFVQTMGSN